MTAPKKSSIFLLFIMSFISSHGWSHTEQAWDEKTVIIAEQTQTSLLLVTDPKAPRQPVPAFDGSGFLRSITGFNITRKGNSGGDISLRGLAGSRINIVNDGQQIMGTCGGRMDPPTNYISPQNYDSVEVIKGPQTVKYGTVGSAGTVLFNHDHKAMAEPGIKGRLNTTAGSFQRLDVNGSTQMGNNNAYWLLNANSSQSGDYKDGHGNVMQSAYNRYSVQTAAGWTGFQDQVIELSLSTSDGHAEYADRANRARKIANDSASILYKKFNMTHLFESIECQLYINNNDHVMDPFDKPIHQQTQGNGFNPRRSTRGGHFWLTGHPLQQLYLSTGLDGFDTSQKTRAGKNYDALMSAPFSSVFSQKNLGVFVEAEFDTFLGGFITGARADFSESRLEGNWALPNQENQKHRFLKSGFARYEYPLDQQEFYIGIGYSERTPDYWEILKAGKSLNLLPEKTRQLDSGWMYHGLFDVSIALYYGEINDYILIDKSTTPMARNIDARIFGGELEWGYSFSTAWRILTTLAYSHGTNMTDQVPLAQISPIEMRIALNYQTEQWGFGAFERLVGQQNRVAVGQGNIVGQDLDKSSGFNILSINAYYKPTTRVFISLGIDNLFNVAYAEHISKSGAGNDAIPIIDRTFRVNEPGRNIWLTVSYEF